MILKPYFKVFLILVLSVCCMAGNKAQSIKDLQNQRKQALKKLETTSKMLNETKKSQKSSITKLSIINKNISERKKVIDNINQEISQLDKQIQQLDDEKHLLENRLGSLKASYVQLVRQAHVKRSAYDKLVFILSAKSFEQSMRRLRYLQEYSSYQKSQAIKIESVKLQISQKNDTLKLNKNSKVEVVSVKQNETQKLAKDQQKEKTVLNDLQRKEAKLSADLKIQQKKANDLNRKIEAIIAEEIRRAEAKKAAERKRLAEENERKLAENRSKQGQGQKHETTQKNEPKVPHKETAPSQSVSILTKEESIISGGFERNRGRLPWPTSNGFIRGHFGIQKHPVLQFVTTNNKGIYIQTPSGSSARAVFEGEVTSVFMAPGSNNGVIIKHGNYRTVYANLTQIYVREGQKVSAKQSIGKIYTDSDNDNKTELYFQIYNGRSLQNPESWIAR